MFSLVVSGLVMVSCVKSETWKEKMLFLSNSISHWKENSCCCQTGSCVSKAMTHFLRKHIDKRNKGEVENRPIRVLEAGAGTGPITEQLVKCLERDEKNRFT